MSLAIRPRSGALAALMILLAIFGCRKHYPLGKLSVQVIDENNAPVQGAAADLYKVTPSGRVYWRASYTSSNGIAVLGAKDGGVIAGDYVIHVSFIDWRKLAQGEANDRPVSVKEGGNTMVTFRTVRRLPVKFK
ncbi:MAG: hypothetical protein ABR582_14415 [Gemmatimonadaceae bacterium]